MSSSVPDQWVLAAVAQATRRRHLITKCPGCTGARIHSKRRNGAGVLVVGNGGRPRSSRSPSGPATAAGGPSPSHGASPRGASRVARRWLGSRRPRSTGRRTDGSWRRVREIQTEVVAKIGDSMPMCQNAISGSKNINVYRGLRGPNLGVQDGPKAPGGRGTTTGREEKAESMTWK